MLAALAPIRRLFCAVALVAVAARADAQLLEVPPFVALSPPNFDISYGNFFVGTTTDSSMVVLTSRRNRLNDKNEVIVQRLSPTGSPLGDVFRIDDTSDVSGARLFADGRGGFIATWRRSIGVPLVSRLLDGSGTPTTAAFTVAPRNVTQVAAGGVPSGVVFAWTSHDPSAVLARRYDVAGTPLGAAFQVAAIPPFSVFGLTVADKGDGGFVVAWAEGGRAIGRLYDVAGLPLGDSFELAAEFEVATVASDPFGGFAVVGARRTDTHARRSGMWARRFATDGTPRGPSFVVDIVDPELIAFPQAGFDPAGRLYVTWGLSSFATQPRGRAYDPAGRPLHAPFRLFEDNVGTLVFAPRPDGRFVEGRRESRDLVLQVRNLCVPPHHTSCGDGVVDQPCERCDDAAANSDTTPDACRTTCATAACGDGVVDHNETCDDGNLIGCDGCDSACNVEVGFVCGDGDVSADCAEECDDGPGNDDSLPDACRTDCRQAHCSDGVLDTGEGCDDGNVTSCDGCSDVCVAEPGLVCGDGIAELLCGEQCDDGNGVDGDGCTEPCRLERVPGGGAPATDCLVEWVVDNPANLPRYDKNGAISGTQLCRDNDPACDFDGGVLGRCTFHLRVCANNTDLPACEGDERLQSWQLRAPSEAKAAKRPALAAVRAAFAPVPGAIVGPPSPDVCSGTLAVPIALRANASGVKAASLVLKSYATRYTGERDSDKIKLICTP